MVVELVKDTKAVSISDATEQGWGGGEHLSMGELARATASRWRWQWLRSHCVSRDQ